MSQPFNHRVAQALADDALRTTLTRSTGILRQRQAGAFDDATPFLSLQELGRARRADALGRLPALLLQLEEQARAHGVEVFWAADAAAASRYILALAEARRVRHVVRSHSAVVEEIGLDAALAQAGAQVLLTQVGDFILSLAGDTPSHPVYPALHWRKEEIARLFEEQLDVPQTLDIQALAGMVRFRLRRPVLEATLSVGGVALAAAETGVLALTDGDDRLALAASPIYVAVMGIEQVTASLEDLSLFLPLYSRSASGQPLPGHAALIDGPMPAGAADGPRELHLVLLDNGRSDLLRWGYGEALALHPLRRLPQRLPGVPRDRRPGLQPTRWRPHRLGALAADAGAARPRSVRAPDRDATQPPRDRPARQHVQRGSHALSAVARRALCRAAARQHPVRRLHGRLPRGHRHSPAADPAARRSGRGWRDRPPWASMAAGLRLGHEGRRQLSPPAWPVAPRQSGAHLAAASQPDLPRGLASEAQPMSAADGRATILARLAALPAAGQPVMPRAPGPAAPTAHGDAASLSQRFVQALERVHATWEMVESPVVARMMLATRLQEQGVKRVLSWTASQLPVAGALEALEVLGIEVITPAFASGRRPAAPPGSGCAAALSVGHRERGRRPDRRGRSLCRHRDPAVAAWAWPAVAGQPVAAAAHRPAGRQPHRSQPGELAGNASATDGPASADLAHQHPAHRPPAAATTSRPRPLSASMGQASCT
jgi:hypothetical protein